VTVAALPRAAPAEGEAGCVELSLDRLGASQDAVMQEGRVATATRRHDAPAREFGRRAAPLQLQTIAG